MFMRCSFGSPWRILCTGVLFGCVVSCGINCGAPDRGFGELYRKRPDMARHHVFMSIGHALFELHVEGQWFPYDERNPGAALQALYFAAQRASYIGMPSWDWFQERVEYANLPHARYGSEGEATVIAAEKPCETAEQGRFVLLSDGRVYRVFPSSDSPLADAPLAGMAWHEVLNHLSEKEAESWMGLESGVRMLEE